MSKGHYSLALDHDRGLVRVRAQGDIGPKLGMELITEARMNAAEHQYKIICDVRESRATVSLSDWYFLPRRLAVYKNWETRTVKTAIIVTAGRQEKVYRFFENVTNNVGLNIKIFLDEEGALEWFAL